MSTSFSVFFLGATGFIGGTFFVDLRATYPNAKITALVRSEKDKDALFGAGANHVVIGTHDDLDVIRAAATDADVVINAAESDNIPLTNALIEVIAQRTAAVGRAPVFVHVSGVALLIDPVGGDGSAASFAVSDDIDEASIRSIPPQAIHRPIDDLIFAADREGKINGYIIAPGLIYGRGRGPKKTLCQLFPTLLTLARQNGGLSYVGEGTNTWDEIHLDDLSDIFLRVLKRGLENADAGKSPHTKFYWGVTQPFTWGGLIKAAVKALHAQGVVKSSEATRVTVEDAAKLQGTLGFMSATSTRAVSGRARSIGWVPKASGILDYLPEGISTAIAHPELGSTMAGTPSK